MKQAHGNSKMDAGRRHEVPEVHDVAAPDVESTSPPELGKVGVLLHADGGVTAGTQKVDEQPHVASEVEHGQRRLRWARGDEVVIGKRVVSYASGAAPTEGRHVQPRTIALEFRPRPTHGESSTRSARHSNCPPVQPGHG